MKDKKIICYDLAMCPNWLSLEEIFSFADRTGYLIFDSTETSKFNPEAKPFMINPNDAIDKILLDISKEKDRKIYEELIKNKI